MTHTQTKYRNPCCTDYLSTAEPHTQVGCPLKFESSSTHGHLYPQIFLADDVRHLPVTEIQILTS